MTSIETSLTKKDVESSHAAATFARGEVTSAQETGRYFIIIAAGALQIIPKRDVPSETLTEFRDLLCILLEGRARLA